MDGGNFKVATISHGYGGVSKKQPIKDFHPTTSLDGDVDLRKPKVVNPKDMKRWFDAKMNDFATPMDQAGLDKLKEAMSKWHPPPSSFFHVLIWIQFQLDQLIPIKVSLSHLVPEWMKPYYVVHYYRPPDSGDKGQHAGRRTWTDGSGRWPWPSFRFHLLLDHRNPIKASPERMKQSNVGLGRSSLVRNMRSIYFLNVPIILCVNMED